MTAFAALVLKNEANVDVTLNPQSIDSLGVAKWMTSNSVFDARTVATMSVALPKAGGKVSRIKQKLMIPVMDAVDTTLKIGEATLFIEAILPKEASETIRLDLRRGGEKLLENAVSTAAFQNLEAIF